MAGPAREGRPPHGVPSGRTRGDGAGALPAPRVRGGEALGPDRGDAAPPDRPPAALCDPGGPVCRRLRAHRGIGGADPDVGTTAKIVHHAVERAKELASGAEARLVNAVVRKMGTVVLGSQRPAGGPIAAADGACGILLAPRVARAPAGWRSSGPGRRGRLLEWNQSPAPLYARWRGRPPRPVPDWLQPTEWKGLLLGALGPLVRGRAPAGGGVALPPGPGHAPRGGAPRPARAGETVLDLCAAPGGKSLLITDALGEGRIVAMDLPTSRIDRLKENLSRTGSVGAALVQADLLSGGAAASSGSTGLPAEYPAVLIDVPCSNTGVMRHRVDVKWRLQPADFSKHERQQGALLAAAAVGARGARRPPGLFDVQHRLRREREGRRRLRGPQPRL